MNSQRLITECLDKIYPTPRLACVLHILTLRFSLTSKFSLLMLKQSSTWFMLSCYGHQVFDEWSTASTRSGQALSLMLPLLSQTLAVLLMPTKNSLFTNTKITTAVTQTTQVTYSSHLHLYSPKACVRAKRVQLLCSNLPEDLSTKKIIMGTGHLDVQICRGT